MSIETIGVRAARPDDAAALADLINFAGEGLPLYLWERLAQPGETAWEVGRRRACREEGSFSYRNAVIAQYGDDVAGSLITYRIADQPTAIDPAEVPAMFVPLLELENLALGTWYVNVLAVYPRFRNLGIGTRLLEVAGQQAKDAGCRGESIIVSDANPGASRLYERCGFRHRAVRPMVKDDWVNPGRNWVLLTR
jgi:ribosomal protein S18 acetylase RimI-like enzyme